MPCAHGRAIAHKLPVVEGALRSATRTERRARSLTIEYERNRAGRVQPGATPCDVPECSVCGAPRAYPDGHNVPEPSGMFPNVPSPPTRNVRNEANPRFLAATPVPTTICAKSLCRLEGGCPHSHAGVSSDPLCQCGAHARATSLISMSDFLGRTASFSTPDADAASARAVRSAMSAASCWSSS